MSANKRWMPTDGGSYWYIDMFGGTGITNYRARTGQTKSGNYFCTKEAAKTASKRVKALLRSLTDAERGA